MINNNELIEHEAPVVFWIDTLCIPVTNPGRKPAIQLLQKTYELAFVTLVLDSELQNVESTVSHAEQLSHLLMSAWMRRLWTLQ